MKRICVIFRTRPEVLKIAPAIKALKEYKDLHISAIFSGQHDTALSYFFLQHFDITPDYHFSFTGENNLYLSFSSFLHRLGDVLHAEKPDLLIVQGDTSTALAGAMAAFYQQIPVAHIEAGLRTHDMQSPYPEEFNRVTISKIAKYHFAPTETAKANLLKEGIKDEVYVVGNTIVDSLLFVKDRLGNHVFRDDIGKIISKYGRSRIVITLHRRENIEVLDGILEAINRLARSYKDFAFIIPVHANPNVANKVKTLLHGDNIFIVPPCDYYNLIGLISESRMVITDSGGIQEEATVLNRPLIIVRNKTERPEALGNGVLVGTDGDTLESCFKWEMGGKKYENSSIDLVTFGDGKSGEKIAKIVHNIFIQHGV